MFFGNCGHLLCCSLKCNSSGFLQSVVVKGLERNVSCLYEARRQLLGLDACESAKVTQMTPDPALGWQGQVDWFNMLLQQLRLSEQGESTRLSFLTWLQAKYFKFIFFCITMFFNFRFQF